VKRYINEFVKLNCASDLLELKLFPNAKEITESMGAFHAVRSVILPETGIQRNDPGITLVSVGDGCTPRTAALFAFLTKWQCYSIDPQLREAPFSIKQLVTHPIERLTVYQKEIEDVIICSASATIVVCVHSHVPLPLVLPQIRGVPRHVVAIPCCIPQDIPEKIYRGYIDRNIWSPKNEVKVWLNV